MLGRPFSHFLGINITDDLIKKELIEIFYNSLLKIGNRNGIKRIVLFG